MSRADTRQRHLDALREREPDKSDAELIADALEFYRVADKPWLTLAEADEYGGDA